MRPAAALGVAALATLAAAGTALAETPDHEPHPPHRADTADFVHVGPTEAEIVPWEAALAGGINSRTLFLNDCKPDGCWVRRGQTSSQNVTLGGRDYTGYSSIGPSGAQEWLIQPFAYSEEVWDQVVACVRATYAPFDVMVIDEDPGTMPHWEGIVAGVSSDAGQGSGTQGIAPFSCGGVINNAISYSFANVHGADPIGICWTVAHELGHTLGLQHEYLREDPMTYLSGSSLPGGVKRFQDQSAQCGTWDPAPCSCGISTQNTFSVLRSVFGAAPPTPPVVTITAPGNGASVAPGDAVRVTVEDDQTIASVALSVDGVQTQSISTTPYIFDLPATLSDGTHRITVTATDELGAQGSATVDVFVGPPCETPGDCAAQGDNLTCVGGRCVPGEGAPGGLGTPCAGPTDCYSGQCASGTEGSLCVELCQVGGSDCPGGYDCLDAGGQGVCWPGDGGDGGGCSTDGGAPSLPIALGVALAAALARRRRA